MNSKRLVMRGSAGRLLATTAIAAALAVTANPASAVNAVGPYGIYAISGGADITASNYNIIRGVTNDGIYASSNGGDIFVRNNNLIRGRDRAAVLLSGGGDVYVTNNNQIADNVAGAGSDIGLLVNAGGGDIFLINTTHPSSLLAGPNGAAMLKTEGTGNIAVNYGGIIMSADINGVAGPGKGIAATVENGNAFIQYNNTNPLNNPYGASPAFVTSGTGIKATATGTGNVVVKFNGVMASGAKGIEVDTTSGKATVNVNDGGSATYAIESSGNAVDVTTTSGGVDINILNLAGVVSLNGDGILVNTQSGNVNIDMTSVSNVAFSGQNGVHVNNQTGNTSIVGANASGLDSGVWVTSTTGSIVADLDLVTGGQYGARLQSQSGLVKVLIDSPTGYVEGDQAVFASTGGAGKVIVDVSADSHVGQGFSVPTRFGITTAAVDGDTSITTKGLVSGLNTGILAKSTGAGDIAVKVLGGSVLGQQDGIIARQTGAGDVNILIDSAMVTGPHRAIFAATDSGDIGVVIQNSATIGLSEIPVFTRTNSGDTKVANKANLTSNGAAAIHSESVDGNIVVDNTAMIVNGASGNGIDAASSGNGNVTVKNGSGSNILARLDAISATGNGTGTVTVNNDGNATGTISGIFASQTGSGNVLVTNNGAAASSGWGINASSTSGSLTVRNHGGVSGTGGGGIKTSATTGNTIVTNFAGATISGPFGIVNTSTDGNITVLNNGSLLGNSPIGISSTSSGAGNILITNNNVITGYDLGILGSSVSGNVTVNNNANLTGDVDGIQAQSTSGTVEVNNNAALITAPGTVISAISSTGTATVNINSGSIVTGGMYGVEIGGATATLNNNSSGIYGDIPVVAVSGNVTVNNGAGSEIASNSGIAISYRGTSMGRVNNSGQLTGAIQAMPGAGTVVVYNNSVWDVAGQANLAGGGTIYNNGVMNLAAGDAQKGADVFYNNHIINVSNQGAAPSVLGATNFGNYGVISVDGRLGLQNNTLFSHFGDLLMSDGIQNDKFVTDGNWSSEGGRVTVDIDLSQFISPNGLSDQILIDGTAATGVGGSTTVFFNRVSPASSGLVLPDIPVVMSGGALNSDAFAGTVGSSGLVDYTFLNSGNNWVVRSSFDNSKAGAALTTLSTSLAAITLSAHEPQPTFLTGPFQPHPGQQDWGLWGRINSGYVDVDHSGSINTFAGKNPLSAQTESNFTTFIGGMDLIGSQVDNWDYVLGVMGGLLRADTFNKGVGGGYHLEAPFVGGYFTATNGAWTIEGNGRYDWYDLDVRNPGLQLTNRDVDGTGVNANMKVAYNADLNGVMVSPNLGLNYTRISLDDFWANNNSAKVSYGDLESLIGSVGINISAEEYIPEHALLVKPFLSVAYLAELDASADTSYVQFDRFGNPAAGFTANYNTVGDFFQVQTGISGVKVDENVTGYVAVEYRNGDNIEGVAVNGGLRKVF